MVSGDRATVPSATKEHPINTEYDESDAEVSEAPSRTRAWTQITLISIGIVVVGIALLVVLWLLFSLTFSLIDEVL